MSNNQDRNENKELLVDVNQDEVMLDDGFGNHVFGSEAWAHINTGKSGAELDAYIEDIKESARVAIDQSIAILTPWFFSNMPQFYYQTTPREEKIRDLHAVITGHIFESKQKLQLWNRDRSKTTFLAPGNDDLVFQDVAENIADLDIKHGAMFTSNDRLLLISSFYTNQFQPVDLENAKNKAKMDRTKEILENEADRACVEGFLAGLDNDMVIHATPERLGRLYKLYSFAKDREDAVTHLIPKYYNEFARLDIAYKKMPISQILAPILYLFERYDFRVNRCVMATVSQNTETPITILTFIVRHADGSVVDTDLVPFLKLNKAAKTLRWVDNDHFDNLWKHKREEYIDYSLNEINLIRAFAAWDQIFLSKLNPYYYSEERIRKTFDRYPEILRDLVQYFKLRFDPRIPDGERRKQQDLEEKILHGIESVDRRIEFDIFKESLNFLKHILKTNYFYPQKTGLAFRMDPDCLNPEHYPNKPYGFFFMIGRGYRGFQVRYRDTSRGGLRILMPKDSSQYEVSFAGLFDEVIGLAYAQQLKNKDIPEGGSKAVVLLAPGADRETAAIGAVDSILNLITLDPDTNKLDPSIIDYFEREEYIYLGPDENCTNELIDAFVAQAHSRGYRFANAFMSSKPGAGINHKEFGVTSEGVNVYLDNLLPELGIDPKKQRFTVKMTGGPDGDVAGNELKILHREYGENARVTAIADGFGCAFDPKGLAWDELLRLVRESRPILDFNPEKLSGDKSAYVIPADTQEHIKMRNTLHATVDADVFIPAGGRPYTVNSDTWKLFLKKDGSLSCKAVVEGANIFFTEEARERLQEAGMLIFKDSSANKCGVICSSFEILSSLILEPAEFMEIKPTYVEQVLQKLRSKADQEAKVLLAEYHQRGKKINLVQLSKVLSDVINRVTDLISNDLDRLTDEQLNSKLCRHIILQYVPPILREKYSDRILEVVPRSYRQAIISADTAARLVYTEGISWFQNLADDDIVQTVQIYVEKERHVAELMEALHGSNLTNKDEILSILERSGARTLTTIARTQETK